jgi:hypothetical protein
MAPLVTKTELFDVDMLQKLVIKEGITHTDKLNLQRYRKRRINANEVLIPYDFGKEYKTLQLGRIHPSPYCGLAVFPKDIRAALAQKYYWDVDIENAQPTLLIVLAKQYEVECPALIEYCENRVSVLDEISKSCDMSRDEAKQICISVLFGGFRGHHPLLPRMYLELKELSLKVSAINPKLFAKCKDAGNPFASCLAVYIQNEERIVLQHVDEFLASHGRSMDVLIYDGGLVRKTSGELEFPSSLLRETEEYIKQKTNYSIRLAVKPLSHTFDVEEKEQLLPATLLINDEYAAKTFVKLVGDRLRKVDGCLWVLLSDGLWSSSPESLRYLISEFSSRLVFKQPGPMGIKLFDYGGNEDKIPKLIKQVGLHALPGEFPLQLAYTLEEGKGDTQEPVDLFRGLVGILASHQPALEEYLLNWLAHMLQKPFQLPGVALIITGRKGYGKDTLFDFLGEFVLGSDYFTNYTENNQLFDHHDTGKVQKLMVKVEEADRAVCMKNSSALKGMITASKMMVNPKNKQPFQTTNFCRYVLTTNKGNPVEFSDGERRYVLLASSGEKKGDLPYWLNLRSKLFTAIGGKQVAEYLLARDISSFIPQSLPANEYQDAVIDSEISIEERFIEDWDGEECSNKDLFRLANLFCRQSNYPEFDSAISFGRRLLAPIRDGKLLKRMSHGSVLYRKPGVPLTYSIVDG